ncbi:MAG: hypothetical protein PHU78_08515 [Heliobacteriaceae bacterium]|nr:hypothetical protein [Heliobacteriaceae bacterium]
MKIMYYIFLILLVSFFGTIGCNAKINSESPNTGSPSINTVSSFYSINNEIKPAIIDEASKFNNSELRRLNEKINPKSIMEIYFLDDNNIIFSANNDAKEGMFYVLYKYNLKDNKLMFLCSEYMLYNDCFVNVKDSSNFSITRCGTFIKVENNKVITKQNAIINEAKRRYPYVTEAFFNADNNKVLLREGDVNNKVNGAYITDIKFTSAQKLPFENIYRVQWMDNENILVAYDDSRSNSILAKYNLEDESIKTTVLPEGNYFIDPVISDNGIIKFLYLDSRTVNGSPRGFLDLNKGIIDRVYFESCNPSSIVRNNLMAGFSQNSPENVITNKLFLYDNNTKTITIRANPIDYPQAVAVSPDGKAIIYVAGSGSGESKFYLNIAIDD